LVSLPSLHVARVVLVREDKVAIPNARETADLDLVSRTALPLALAHLCSSWF
jgi:hypothetical protein